jgi:hypothetical protein
MVLAKKLAHSAVNGIKLMAYAHHVIKAIN